MSQAYISPDLRRQIAAAAHYRCRYCLTSQTIIGMPLHIEHIIPLAADGQTSVENLWLASAIRLKPIAAFP